MAIRTEQTLRRMWIEAADNQADAVKLGDAYDGHTSAAEAAEQTAKAHRSEASKAKFAADEYAAQAADLVDMVNEKRQQAGLAPLKLGESYPVDPSDPAVTRTDGEVAQP
jgi:uncharacterized protein YkwD